MATVEAPPAEELTFGDVRISRLHVLNRDGKDFVRLAGLLEGLQQLSRGYYDLTTDLVQLPTDENGRVAVMTARVTVFDPESGRVLRTASGLGDADAGNTSRMMAPHLPRMAESRAIARALRMLLGLDMTSFEELGPGGPEGGADERTPAASQNAPVRPATGERVPAAEHILIAGRSYDRPQVVAGYKKVLAEARDAGLTIAPADLVPEDAPLSLLAGAAQSVRRRLEVRSTGT